MAMMSSKELREHAEACFQMVSRGGQGKACPIAVARLWARCAEDTEQKNWEAERRVKGAAASPDQRAGCERADFAQAKSFFLTFNCTRDRTNHEGSRC